MTSSAISQVLDEISAFTGSLSPREKKIFQAGLRASHIEEAAAYGEFNRAQGHVEPYRKITREIMQQNMLPGGVHLDVDHKSSLGAVCDPNANPPVPDGVIPWARSGVRLTPAMQQWAASIANDLSIPIGAIFKKWFDNVPVVAICLCHDYTVLADGTKRYGAYHGTTLFYPTKAEMMPSNETSLTKPPVNVDGTSATSAVDVIQLIFLGTVLASASFAITNAVLQARNGNGKVAA